MVVTAVAYGGRLAGGIAGGLLVDAGFALLLLDGVLDLTGVG